VNVAAALFVPLLLSTQTPDFEGLKKGAEAIESIPRALSVIVGNCDTEDIGEQIDCRENVKKQRQGLLGKRVYLYLGPIEASQLKYEGDRGKGIVRVVWTAPIYDAGSGLALTVGKPQSVSSAGNLVIRPALLDGKLGEGILDSELQRLIRTGMVSVELIGKFKGPWTLKGKGQTFQGAELTAEAVRLTNARTGKTLLVARL
jgi:hypothetical protein